MIALVSPQCLTPRASAGRSIYDLSKTICLTTRRNIPCMTIALFLDGSRSCPAFRVASSAPEAIATRRCILRLGAATPPWSSSWSLRGPRWTRPLTTAVAPEGFSGSFCEWLWRDDIGSWFSCCALGCWVVLVLVFYKDPLLWWDGPIEIRLKGIRWNE